MSSANPRSGGIFVPIGIFGGLIAGAFAGQLMVGVLGGTAVGAAAATLLWLKDRASPPKT